ncbi:MAG TPA: hypothetical protein VHB02_05075 [Acidimicrobiales bacterium]|nr:hypothetical protein [Acidimicrobiales bacterium]
MDVVERLDAHLQCLEDTFANLDPERTSGPKAVWMELVALELVLLGRCGSSVHEPRASGYSLCAQVASAVGAP